MPLSNDLSSSSRKQKEANADLSIFEKLNIIPSYLSTLANVVVALFSGSLRSKETVPASYYRYVALTAMRTLLRKTTVRQQHYMFLTTDESYEAVCKARRVKPSSEILEDGTRANWIGNPKAQKIVLNFHGGGYVLPASPEWFDFMFDVVDSLKSAGKDAACLFLSYDLAGTAPYPRQLQQASALLNHVLNTLKIEPSNIILTGDSAGGNLVLALLSHISHPHPSTTVPIPNITLSSPLCGAVLISPWVSFNTDTPSFQKNAYKDCIGFEVARKWSSAFLAHPWPLDEVTDNYNQGLMAPSEWWKDLQVEEVLIVAGEEEVLLDGIRDFEKKFSSGFGQNKVEIVVAKGEYHDQASFDKLIGYKEKKDEGLQAKTIKQWVGSKL